MKARHALGGVIVLLTISFASSARAGETWNSLWRNADQRGEQLLHDGKAADAARTYHDPRRRAYAQIAAGDYQSAAQAYAAFDDGESQYNRGNALARSGDLNGAIEAYDAALKKDPGNADAKKNRALVEKALQRQQKQKQKQKQNDSSQSQQQNEQPQSQNGQDQNQKQPSSSDQKQNDQHSSAPQNGSDSNQRKAAQDQDNKDQGKYQQNNKSGSPSPQDERAAQQQQQQADDKAQAQQDAKDAANAANAAGNQRLQADADKPAQAAARPSDTPKSEQQLAEEQWLRQIPDDPGGLLRRKFMIEHLMRKQQDQGQ